MALQAWIGDPLLAVAVRAATSSDVNCSTRGRNIRDGPLNVARVADVSGADLCVTSPSKRVITADEAARLDDSAPTTITAVTLPNEPMSSRYKGEYSPLIRFCLAIPRIFARAGKTNAGDRCRSKVDHGWSDAPLINLLAAFAWSRENSDIEAALELALNIAFTDEELAAVRAAAASDDVSLRAFAHRAILAAASEHKRKVAEAAGRLGQSRGVASVAGAQ
jgi:hypothetical protein